MALDKYSYKSDQIANLYRAAFYLARGAKETGLGFLKKTKGEFRNLLLKPGDYLENKKDRIYWSEKILDRYIELKHLLKR